MTIILLTCFFWQIGVILFGDEEKQAKKYEKMWLKFLEVSGLKLD